MSKYIDEQNEEKFFDSFVHNMTNSLMIQKKGVMKLPPRVSPTKIDQIPKQDQIVSQHVSSNTLSPRLKENCGHFKNKAHSMLDPNTIVKSKTSQESLDLLSPDQQRLKNDSPSKVYDKKYQERMSLLKQFAGAIKDTAGRPEVEGPSYLDVSQQRSRYSSATLERRARRNTTFAT